MTTAQLIFSVALGVISLIIVWFAAYVVWTSTWGDRWYGKDGRSRQISEDK